MSERRAPGALVIAIAVALVAVGGLVAYQLNDPPQGSSEAEDRVSAEPQATEGTHTPPPTEGRADPAPSLDAAPTPPPQAIPTCEPGGFVPTSYRSTTIAEDGRVDLDSGWSLYRQARGRSATSALPDSEATPLTVPGFTPLGLEGRKVVFWAVKTFTVAEDADLGALSLDLGARQGTTTVWLNGKKVAGPVKHHPILIDGERLAHGKNEVRLQLELSSFSGGLHWAGTPALGVVEHGTRGHTVRTFVSKVDGSRQSLAVFIPPCGDLVKPRPLLLALPGWGGNPDGYRPSRLYELAEERDMIVVVPDPRGNVLYIDKAEDGVLEALDLVMTELLVDKDRVHIMGLSMGGAGALQLAYHYPDRFASVAAWYGDSKYDMGTYVKSILKTREQADRYSVINFAANSRNFPVLLIHAHDDAVSPVEQSIWLFEEAQALGLKNHHLIDPPKGGHSFAVVEDHLDDAFTMFDAAVRNPLPARVAFRSNSWRYVEAWWIEVVPARDGAFGRVDVAWDPDADKLHFFAFDSGLEAVRIDADALDLVECGEVSIEAEVELEGEVILKKLVGVNQVHFWKEGMERFAVLVPVEHGSARLPMMGNGLYHMDFR